jgi:murein DD-endopeptidase MepM/ murein hydrolase activator NlpD
LKEFIGKMIEQSKEISIKRVLVLGTFMFFITGIAFLSVLVSAGQSTALTSLRPETLSNLLKEKGQNLDNLYNNKYSEICSRDKELAYIYLKKKLRDQTLPVTLYTIQNKENFWTVARKFGINIDTIIGANPELKSMTASLGQQVIVPAKRGVIHEVKDRDENLDLLAQLYKVKKEDIKTANGLGFGGFTVGDLLFIPNAKPVYMNENLQKLFSKRSLFRSPLSGVYTSLFGPRIHPVTGEGKFHEGVDIRADIGTWVGAAADGVVVFAGWEDNIGYCIKIQHKDGYTTLYGHLSKIYVRPYQKVFAGKLIAKSGNSGRTTGPHLHFGVYKNGRAVNPMTFLW